MRLFIAIDINEEIRKALGELQRQLQRKADFRQGDVKWVRPELIHLTLKFLGEVEDEKITSVCETVKDVAGKHESFELNIESVGCFGGRSAKVLWVGTGDGKDKLFDLQKDLEEKLALAGFAPEDREFSGHLTLCRIKSSAAGFKLAAMSKDFEDLRLGVISVDSVSVYQSQLTPAGPVYTVLGNYKLQ
jgi:2'-5' RNA ligase